MVTQVLYFIFLQVKEVIVDDFNILSRAYVYWEEMTKHEIENSGRFEVEMTIAFRKLRDILLRVMCSVHELHNEGSCSVMPYYEKNLYRAQRFERDYEVAVSTTNILKFMSTRYSKLI